MGQHQRGGSVGRNEATNQTPNEAVRMLTTDINNCAHRQKLSSIDEIDSILCAIADETNNVVGANATLPISIAATHAIADSYGLSTWRYISTLPVFNQRFLLP